MIKITDSLWIGKTFDEAYGDLNKLEIDATLNVAHDLQASCGWEDGIEAAQVGLIDGPGNEASDYCAAVLCLKTLLRRNNNVLVFDHDGCRAFVVAMMYLNLDGGQIRTNHLSWSYWPTWDERLEIVCRQVDEPLPKVHQCHIDMFNKMPWGVMEVL